MAVQLNPYLSFRDQARPALEHYRSILGGTLEVTTFGEADASEDPAEADLVMHGLLTTDDDFVLMASDTPAAMTLDAGSSISISLSGDDEPRLRGWFEGLAEGGEILMPFEPAPWGDTFGMVRDRFGTSWMLNAAGRA